MGPGKKQGILMIALEKDGGEMTVKAHLLQKLSATKGHHHGCMCEVCFLECYGTDYYGFVPDDQELGSEFMMALLGMVKQSSNIHVSTCSKHWKPMG